MKFMFVCMGAENLAAEQLSAILKEKGHEVDLAFDPALFDDKTYFYIPLLNRFLNERDEVVEKIISARPDVIGFTVFTDNYDWACHVASRVKEKLKDTPIIFGGIYPTTCPEVVLMNDFVDIVCVGEGEKAIPELLSSMENGGVDYSIKNLWFKRDGKVVKNTQRPLVDLNTLPYYDKELFAPYVPLDRVYLTVTSRACLFRCSFCSQNFMKKFNKRPDTRIKTVDYVIGELKAMKKRYNFREVDFKDNILTMNKKWVLDFLKRYKKEIGVPYRALSHVLCIDEDIARALVDSGCHRVQFGIQSLNEETRKKHLLRTESNEQIDRALRICDAAGLEYSCDHMFGLPGETEEDQMKAARFYKSLKKCTRVTCFWTTFFPKTDLVDIALREGIIGEGDVAQINSAKAGYYYCEGAVRNEKDKRVFKNYQMLFRLLPILPETLVDYILDRGLHRHLHLLPQTPLLLPIDLLVSVVKTDHSAFQYMHYYFHNIGRKVGNVLGLRSKR